MKQSKEEMRETPFSLVVTVDVHNLTSRGRFATSLPKTQNSVLSPFSYIHLLDEDQYSLSNQCREILHSQLYIIRETPCCPRHPKQADSENVVSLRRFNSFILMFRFLILLCDKLLDKYFI